MDYIVKDNTHYAVNTPSEVVDVLHHARKIHSRIRVHYGDVKTGKDWQEEYDIMGYVGRSNGKYKVPILVHNIRSMGGGAILTHCIVMIKESRRNGKVLYKHPTYKK